MSLPHSAVWKPTDGQPVVRILSHRPLWLHRSPAVPVTAPDPVTRRDQDPVTSSADRILGTAHGRIPVTGFSDLGRPVTESVGVVGVDQSKGHPHTNLEKTETKRGSRTERGGIVGEVEGGTAGEVGGVRGCDRTVLTANLETKEIARDCETTRTEMEALCEMTG